MSIFKSKGFDTLIGKDTVIKGLMVLNGSTVIDGHFDGESIHSDRNADAKQKDTLHVNGTVTVEKVIISHDLTVCGSVTAKEVRVEGTLAVKGTAKLTADVVYYRTLVIEPGAVILAQLKHLDHVSEGEQV